MCTAINTNNNLHLFGRTLDFERSFGQEIISTPRDFKHRNFNSTYSVIGVATVVKDAVLFFDGMNEAGLCGGALNFPNYAVYHSNKRGVTNLASYELLPYVLGGCRSVKEARHKLEKINITPESFSQSMPSTPLHWIFADRYEAITVESVYEGLKVYENPFGILTNSPPFDYHLIRLADYMYLTSNYPENCLTEHKLLNYSRGMGAMGLPGDFSSSSRFVRAAFLLKNTIFAKSDIESFFHIMDLLSVPDGCVKTASGESVKTVYTSCACTDDLTYRFTTYESRMIREIRLDPTCKELQKYPMK